MPLSHTNLLPELGAKVVVSGRREAEGHVVVAAISKAGGKASFFKGDTSREADMKALVEFAVKSYGGLNYAFNNAGVEGEMGVNSDHAKTEENYRRTFDINVLGVVLSMEILRKLPAILASWRWRNSQYYFRCWLPRSARSWRLRGVQARGDWADAHCRPGVCPKKEFVLTRLRLRDHPNADD